MYITLGVMTKTGAEANSRYAVIALLVAPAIAAFGLAVSAYVQGDAVVNSPAKLLPSTLIFYSYAFAATLLLGLPSFLVFRRLKLVRWWSSIMSGVVIGLIAKIAVDPSGTGLGSSALVIWGGLGGLSALVFWLVWLLGLPKHGISN